MSIPAVSLATTWITKHEPAYLLAEMDLLSPVVDGNQDLHRYQIIYVNRNDRISEYRTDLGLSSAFDTEQFRIVALWEHTVAEVQEMAQFMRLRGKSDASRILEEERGRVEETMIPAYHDAEEQRYKNRRHESVFGPGRRIERSR